MATTASETESSFGVSGRVSGAGGRSSSKVQNIQRNLYHFLKKLINLIQDNTESKVITQIENEVNAELHKVHNVDIIELELPRIKAKGKKCDKIFEAIHNIFNAEIVDNKLFIKFNGRIKSEAHKKLYQPDMGGWNPKPALNQRIFSIINPCPPPLLWIKMTYDNSGDYDNIINKFARVQPTVRPQNLQSLLFRLLKPSFQIQIQVLVQLQQYPKQLVYLVLYILAICP
ncbi:21177_t:CDS:2 [Dentiscutata erythropus]|uniref:21177_t:CDS:1 n=1 Tax=Dentiscutata erythropus TaxID=1348616 RepID=A0A9N9IM62_9GLOM|nr:21177_t:CDS:2 [Dentiscutata erythropus]